jgi:hypothetical protein
MPFMSSYIPAASPALADRLWIVRRSRLEEAERAPSVARLEAELALVRANVSEASAQVPLGKSSVGTSGPRMIAADPVGEGSADSDDDGEALEESEGMADEADGMDEGDSELDAGEEGLDEDGSYLHGSDLELEEDVVDFDEIARSR